MYDIMVPGIDPRSPWSLLFCSFIRAIYWSESFTISVSFTDLLGKKKPWLTGACDSPCRGQWPSMTSRFLALAWGDPGGCWCYLILQRKWGRWPKAAYTRQMRGSEPATGGRLTKGQDKRLSSTRQRDQLLSFILYRQGYSWHWLRVPPTLWEYFLLF